MVPGSTPKTPAKLPAQSESDSITLDLERSQHSNQEGPEYWHTSQAANAIFPEYPLFDFMLSEFIDNAVDISHKKHYNPNRNGC